MGYNPNHPDREDDPSWLTWHIERNDYARNLYRTESTHAPGNVKLTASGPPLIRDGRLIGYPVLWWLWTCVLAACAMTILGPFPDPMLIVYGILAVPMTAFGIWLWRRPWGWVYCILLVFAMMLGSVIVGMVTNPASNAAAVKSHARASSRGR